MMVGYYGGDLGWWGWLVMTLGMVAFWGALITLIVLLVRGDARGRSAAVTSPLLPDRPTPERLLAERLARGEITEDQYRGLLGTLTATVKS